MTTLEGGAVLVTGAASGIGRATTQRLATDGAAVAAVDRAGEGAAETARLVGDAGGRAIASTADVSREDDVVAAVDGAVEAFGGLSGVVTCAGIFDPGDLRPAADVALDDYLRVIGVNLTGTFLAIKYAPAPRRAQGRHRHDRVHRRHPRARSGRGVHRQ